QVPRILAESGVRFLVVEALPSSKIDGVSFWLNNEYPVIALTMRFDRIDNFCFVLRHECEHILREDGRNQEFGINIDIEMEKRDLNISEIENLANLAASDFCVPERLMETFIARKEPLFDQNSLLGFARTIGVHPGVVVGQLQKKTGRYNLFRNYLVKIKDYIIPNAYVDGWGNVFPIDK
ncbi:MAG: XRE family transcriptional regulator, partial [Alphaproteobacteria bacterium]|nr:XRE family transcriptional regulator [Alphaproteobacteria bacterium]